MFWWDVKKYDEELFTNLFDVTNKIKIKKICIQFNQSLSNEDMKNIYKKIISFETQKIISNEVSCFIKLL